MPNGLDFERQVHALLKKMGFEAEITKASGDGGIDIIAHSKEHITGGKYIIQCKDWSNPVGEPPVRDLYGVVAAEKANKGILITTSTFTSPAIKFAENKPLELIDGTKFNQLLSKYGLAGIEGESRPAPDDERIKDLTDKLNKNPKNILIMKELADIYLVKGFCDEAIKLYERLVPLKPSVETERLSCAYWDGINNYGVALAMQKRYDEAIKLFRQNNYVLGVKSEANLAHYLGLFDVATSLYNELRSASNDKEYYDEMIEKAYLQNQLDFPSLTVLIATKEMIEKPLETARQKAGQEGDKAIYQGLIEAYCGINEDICDFADELTSLFTSLLESKNFGSEQVESTLCKLVEIKDKSNSAIANYGHVAGIVANNRLQECYKEIALNQLEVLKSIHDGISKHFDFLASADNANQLMSVFKNKTEKAKMIEPLYEQLNEEFKKVEAKWEEIIKKEKAEWREKLRNTLYANWSPKNSINTQPNKQCFIATAVYGSSFSPEVEALRQWRDRSLSTTSIGRSLISTYYKYSPAIARYIKHRPVIKGGIKKALNGVVRVVRRKER